MPQWQAWDDSIWACNIVENFHRYYFTSYWSQYDINARKHSCDESREYFTASYWHRDFTWPSSSWNHYTNHVLLTCMISVFYNIEGEAMPVIERTSMLIPQSFLKTKSHKYGKVPYGSPCPIRSTLFYSVVKKVKRLHVYLTHISTNLAKPIWNIIYSGLSCPYKSYSITASKIFEILRFSLWFEQRPSEVRVFAPCACIWHYAVVTSEKTPHSEPNDTDFIL